MNRNEKRALRAVKSNTRAHEMTVLHDDGLYRHLRFQCPGSSIWYFDIITWPGSLTIRGDIGEGYTFTRSRDMFEFFNHPFGYINTVYWAEKLERACSDSAKDFDERAFLRQGIETITEYWDLTPQDRHDAIISFKEELDEQYPTHDFHYQVAEAFTFTDSAGETHEFSDVWEWASNDWKFHFLVALHAIVWGINTYKKASQP